MRSNFSKAFAVGILLSLIGLPLATLAQQTYALPSPLRIEQARGFALKHRKEIMAARARAQAASQRPTIVSTLEDPMLMPALDRLPFSLKGADVSLQVQQSFPLSSILSHRQRAAEAEAKRWQAEVSRTGLDVELAAAAAFLMLYERRQMAQVLTEQLALARQFVSAANARYAAGPGAQPDVLRAESEVARLEASVLAIASEVRAAEAMLNASLNRPADAPMPPLASAATSLVPPSWEKVREQARDQRPELSAARAAVRRSEAEVSVMKSMYLPMSFIRTGPAYTMNDRMGWMFMFGVSVPIWRSRLRAGVSEAQAMTDMAHADVQAMSTMVEGEAASARHRVQAARDRFLALRDNVVPRTKQVIEPTLAQYAVGKLPLVSVIDAARAMWTAQADRVAAEFELGLAWAQLQRATGTLATKEQP